MRATIAVREQPTACFFCKVKMDRRPFGIALDGPCCVVCYWDFGEGPFPTALYALIRMITKRLP